jgi:hypothetical protein
MFGFQIITERSSPEDLPCAGSYKLSIRLPHFTPILQDRKEFPEKSQQTRYNRTISTPPSGTILNMENLLVAGLSCATLN